MTPTNTAELVYTEALLWISLVVFSGCMGVLMNLISNIYQEGQERRDRLMELAKYMNLRVLPRTMKHSIRRYLNFVWECTAKNRELEELVLQKLSPPLKRKVCTHIFGATLAQCEFLSWTELFI